MTIRSDEAGRWSATIGDDPASRSLDDAPAGPAGPIERFAEFVKRLWRGEVSLLVTFWGFGVAGGLLLNIPFFIESTGAFNEPRNLILLTLSINAAAAVLVTYTLFTAVAIWRSATLYEGPLIWSVLAKVVVIVRVLPFVVGFLKFFIPEQ